VADGTAEEVNGVKVGEDDFPSDCARYTRNLGSHGSVAYCQSCMNYVPPVCPYFSSEGIESRLSGPDGIS